MLCGDLDGWDGGDVAGKEVQEGQDICTHVHIEGVHTVVQQKLTQHCKAIILQLKINLKNKIQKNNRSKQN